MQTIAPQLHLTRAEVMSIAPSSAVLAKAKRLARPWSWLELGQSAPGDDAVIWGRITAAKEPPLLTMVRLRDLRTHCTCTARIAPCAHVVALLLLHAVHEVGAKHHQPEALPAPHAARVMPDDKTVPEDVQAHMRSWPVNAAPPPLRAGEAYARRRLPRLLQGLDTLERWLCDLVGGGLHAATYRPGAFWAAMAHELESRHAPRLASDVRALAKLPGRAPDWPEPMVATMGRMYLLIHAFRRYADATPARRSDLHAAVGWPVLWDGDRPQRDHWQILAARPTTARATTVRPATAPSGQPRIVWLAGTGSGALYALTVRTGDGAPANLLRVGRTVDATLLPAHGGAPTRAVMHQWHALHTIADTPAIPAAMRDLVQGHARSLAANPWHEATPALLACEDCVNHAGRWYVRGQDDLALPLPHGFEHGWTLRSLHLGGRLVLFGEWDGQALTPHAVWTNTGWTELRTLRGVK